MQHHCICTVYSIMKTTNKNVDIMGTTTSLACAVHCAAMPLLLSSGAISSHSWIANPLFEITILVITAFLIYNSIIKGFLNGKSNRYVFSIACIGLLLIVTHHLFSSAGTIVIIIGGILVALSHMLNLRTHRHKTA